MKMLWKKLCKKKGVKFLFALLTLLTVERFCASQTEGFRFYEILSEMPNKPEWETPFPQEALSLLEQPFTLLGKGEQCYAFIGHDEKTVLKFFRHDHLSPKQLLPDALRTKLPSRTDLTPLLLSAKLAFDRLKEETGLLAIHLNKTENLCGKLTLLDKLGIQHTIDLDATEFILQRRAAPFCVALDEKMRLGNLSGAAAQLHSLEQLLHTQCQKGIRNSDTAFKRNFGAIDDRAVLFDIGSFYVDESVKEQESEEIARTTQRLQRWLKKHHPELLNLSN